MRRLVCTLVILVLTAPAIAQRRGGDSGGGDSGPGWGQKYEARKAQRFDLLSFLSDQRRVIADQNSRLSAGGGNRWFYPDIVLNGLMMPSDISRDGGKIGTAKITSGRLQFILNNLFTRADQRRAMNFDVGFEGLYEDMGTFVPSGASPTNWNYRTTGTALVLRPLGRSSQDTSLLFKFGSLRVTSDNLMSVTGPKETTATYYGAEGRLYLLPIIGVHLEYLKTAETADTSFGGTWSMTDIKYGAFVEFYLLQLGAYITQRDWTITPTGGAKITESQPGTAFTATLFF